MGTVFLFCIKGFLEDGFSSKFHKHFKKCFLRSPSRLGAVQTSIGRAVDLTMIFVDSNHRTFESISKRHVGLIELKTISIFVADLHLFVLKMNHGSQDRSNSSIARNNYFLLFKVHHNTSKVGVSRQCVFLGRNETQVSIRFCCPGWIFIDRQDFGDLVSDFGIHFSLHD